MCEIAFSLYKRDLWLKHIFANISNCSRLTECQFFFCYWWRSKLSKFIERKTLYPKTRLGPKSAFGGRTIFYYILEWSTLKLLSRIRTGPVRWVGNMRKAAVFRTPYGPRTELWQGNTSIAFQWISLFRCFSNVV